MLKKTKDFRLAEWKKILTEANSSGMSKRAWCKANGINERKLYYWQHRIWQTESTGHHLSAEHNQHNLPVRASRSLPDNGFVEVDLAHDYARVPKESADWISRVAHTHQIL